MGFTEMLKKVTEPTTPINQDGKTYNFTPEKDGSLIVPPSPAPAPQPMKEMSQKAKSIGPVRVAASRG